MFIKTPAGGALSFTLDWWEIRFSGSSFQKHAFNWLVLSTKNSARKNKKSAVRGRKRTPVGKLKVLIKSKLFIFSSDAIYHPMNFCEKKLDLDKMQCFVSFENV